MSVWCFDGIEEFMPGDSGNVLRLCDDYFVILKWLVQEWYLNGTDWVFQQANPALERTRGFMLSLPGGASTARRSTYTLG